MEFKNLSPKIYLTIAGATIILVCLIGKYGDNVNNHSPSSYIAEEQFNVHIGEIEKKQETNTIDDKFQHIYGITNENEDLELYGWVI